MFDPDAPIESVVLQTRTPVAGETSASWRLATVVAWIAVAVALGSVWKVSDQLGMSTWWLGPRGEPQPRAVQLIPFVPPLVMLVAAINNVRRLPWIGLLCSAAIVAIGVVDLGYIARLGVLEIAVGAAAAAVSVGSTAGVLRPVGDVVDSDVAADEDAHRAPTSPLG